MVVGDRAGSDVALHLNEAGQLLLALMEATEREQVVCNLFDKIAK